MPQFLGVLRTIRTVQDHIRKGWFPVQFFFTEEVVDILAFEFFTVYVRDLWHTSLSLGLECLAIPGTRRRTQG